MNRLHTLLYVIAIASTAMIASCSKDSDSGDGPYSKIMASYADITIKDDMVISIITDENDTLVLPKSMRYNGENGADTMIRRLIYYTKYDDVTPIELLQTRVVDIVTPVSKDELPDLMTDPLEFLSAWHSQNNKYFNMQLGLLVGNDDNGAKEQTLKIRLDSVSTVGKGRVFYSIYHDQAGMEKYYTEEYSVSIPMPQQDSVTVFANTTSVVIERTYVR